MKCILMNKNTEVLLVEYDVITKGFNKLYEIKNISFAPIILNHLYEKEHDDVNLLEQLTEWFKGRGIPSWRDDLDLLLT